MANSKSSQPKPGPKLPKMTGGSCSGVGRLQKNHLPVPKMGKK